MTQGRIWTVGTCNCSISYDQICSQYVSSNMVREINLKHNLAMFYIYNIFYICKVLYLQASLMNNDRCIWIFWYGILLSLCWLFAISFTYQHNCFYLLLMDKFSAQNAENGISGLQILKLSRGKHVPKRPYCLTISCKNNLLWYFVLFPWLLLPLPMLENFDLTIYVPLYRLSNFVCGGRGAMT